jgi:hypothetical protein
LQGKAYSKKKVVDAYVSVGLLDERTKTCPDIFKMMERFGHSHNNNAIKRNEFLDRLPAIMKAQITDGMVKEEVYDKLLVDSDCDLLGNDWGLKSSSDIQSRAKILSNRSLLNEKFAFSSLLCALRARIRPTTILARASKLKSVSLAILDNVSAISNTRHNSQYSSQPTTSTT